jgi:hypothetical protein
VLILRGVKKDTNEFYLRLYAENLINYDESNTVEMIERSKFVGDAVYVKFSMAIDEKRVAKYIENKKLSNR